MCKYGLRYNSLKQRHCIFKSFKMLDMLKHVMYYLKLNSDTLYRNGIWVGEVHSHTEKSLYIGKMTDVDMVPVRDPGGGKNDGEYYINVSEPASLKNSYPG